MTRRGFQWMAHNASSPSRVRLFAEKSRTSAILRGLLCLVLSTAVMPISAEVSESTRFYSSQLKRVSWATMPFKPLSGTMVPIIGFRSTHRFSDAAKYDAVIKEMALRYELDPNLVHAIIKTESGYDPLAISPKGAVGLMQLMPDTAVRFNVSDPFDPDENIRAGCQYVRWLMERFHRDLELVLAAYNAGEKNVLKNGGRVPQFDETLRYIERVKYFYFEM